MRNMLFLLVIFYHAVICCNFSDTTPKIYIKTTTLIGQNKSDSLSIVNTDYFDVGLCQFVDRSKGYYAGKDIENPTSTENFRSIFFKVSNEDGSELYFKTSTEFLNFMSERKYEMVSQTTSKYCTDYTFKKK